MGPFLNIKAGVIIAAIALIWPIQQISMSIIFEPILFYIKRKLWTNRPMSKTRKDKDGNALPLIPFFKKGNFAPIQKES